MNMMTRAARTASGKLLFTLSALSATVSAGAARAQAGDVVLSCNSGALTVEADEDQGGFRAVVWDTGVVDHFKALEGTSVKTVQHGYPSLETSKRVLPPQASFANLEGRAVLIVSGLRNQNGEPSYFAGQHLPYVRPVSGTVGYRFAIDNSLWTGSHSYVSYEYGNWFFEDCELL